MCKECHSTPTLHLLQGSLTGHDIAVGSHNHALAMKVQSSPFCRHSREHMFNSQSPLLRRTVPCAGWPSNPQWLSIKQCRDCKLMCHGGWLTLLQHVDRRHQLEDGNLEHHLAAALHERDFCFAFSITCFLGKHAAASLAEHRCSMHQSTTCSWPSEQRAASLAATGYRAGRILQRSHGWRHSCPQQACAVRLPHDMPQSQSQGNVLLHQEAVHSIQYTICFPSLGPPSALHLKYKAV